MTDRIEIPAGGDNIHVFGLDLTGPEAEAFVARPANTGGGWPLKVRLGASSLDPAHVEHFPVSDLAGVGLPGYLTEGLGADAAAVEAERDRLEALRGDVVILRPSAFGDTAQSLTPEPPLHHVGSFPPARPVTTMERIRTPAAEGAGQGTIPMTPPPTSRALKWLAALAAFVIVVGILVLATGGFS
ncbi:hypothetical protein [Pseudooceanicola nanhaiensis]|uniref:hypothetical protein n=1 Tax=Pseudooceanicola nanhaiensis TaxID=375761 RepID=UPI0035148177